jgi:release factor glutamine methyltransferase
MIDLLNAHRKLTEYLERHGVENPRLCSEILISNALEIPRIDVYTKYDRPMKDSDLAGIRALGRRLIGGEPLQLITGDTQFFSFNFKTAPGVFIPRPETEILVETTARALEKTNQKTPRILDLCAGSGVIAVSILKIVPEATAVAVDISKKSFDLTSENALRLGVESRIECLIGDLYKPLPPGTTFDAIVSNPPYIPSSDIGSLSPTVRDFDPRESLDGGPDGLDTIRRILQNAPDNLREGGFIAFEIGISQSEKALLLARDAGFTDCTVIRDLGGIERVITGCKEKKH